MAFEHENALLVAAAGLGPSEAFLPAPDLDWTYLADAAQRQGVAPLVHAWLERQPARVVPEADARRFRDAYWTSHFRNRRLLAIGADLVAAAAGRGLTLAPLKGAALAAAWYPSPGLRPLSDLDYLAPVDAAAGLGTLLAERGYQRARQEPSYVDEHRLGAGSADHAWVASEGGLDVVVEYRTDPLETSIGRLTDLDPEYTAALGAHASIVWARAGREDPGSGPQVSREDLLLHVATHMAAKHADFRLIWLHDLGRLAAGAAPIDWGYVAGVAARLRAAGPVLASLEAARRWLGAAFTERELAPLRRALAAAGWLQRREYRQLARYAASLGARDLRREGPGVRALGPAFARLIGWGPRLRALRWVLLPGRAYLEHHALAPHGPAGYARAIVRRYLRGLGRLVAGRAGGR